MSESKFTPGPWVYLETMRGSREVEITTQKRIRASRVPICEMNIYFDGLSGIEQEANVHLIAAAPELLEALEEMVLEYGKRGGSQDEILPASYQNELIAHSIRVIAKAKGKAQEVAAAEPNMMDLYEAAFRGGVQLHSPDDQPKGEAWPSYKKSA